VGHRRSSLTHALHNRFSGIKTKVNFIKELKHAAKEIRIETVAKSYNDNMEKKIKIEVQMTHCF
jgi:hypothetical protein